MKEIKNARIESTMLGYEDHGLLTCSITLDYGGALQGFGGYCLGDVFTDQWIKGVLKCVGVETWEKLKGVYVRAQIEDGRITAIGHILEDKWFKPKDLT